MKDQIMQLLHKIEEKENIRILLAVESGSRAWGFASPDSDYDVRFIYVRPREEYLKLENTRDVIELPIDEVLDVNGWDLNKTLRLLRGSNPTLLEWLYSPIVYMEREETEKLKDLAQEYFSPKKILHHYLRMAERNAQLYLGKDMVRVKKYFYVLRPQLACRWILDQGTTPPVLFSELMEAELPGKLRPDVERLLELKSGSGERKEIERVAVIEDYLTSEMEQIKEAIQQMEEPTDAGWEGLNEYFLWELNQGVSDIRSCV
ncbi:MAG: nucleotidyltransferase domain-containing protein [Lachnospiraceae bacterium]|nr:nucleotidyltransferase domain-containing protein [Lachnospiraceae bacterium]